MGLENCIDQQDLKAFALGNLDEHRSDEIAAHLSACIRCEETIAGFDDTDDSMLVAVREAAVDVVAAATSTPAEVVLQQIANPWSSPGDVEKPTTTGEWIRDYELLEQLGRGGMGTVYKAVHARLQRPVAIKLLPSRRLRDPDAVARFEREMRAIGKLDHPAIVRATDAGDADGTHFLVMDYVEGIDLSQLIKLTGPMDVASACEVIRQAAIGLQYAHDQGLIHRDVKPSNLMVEVSLQGAQGGSTRENAAFVKLLDLGLALFGAASEAVDELTTVGQLMGTLDYMAPEQADNSHDVDARADVYSLGATMFKLLTGTAPYETSERRTPLQKMKALATVDAPSIKTRDIGLPDDVAVIVDRMLLRERSSRFQTAAEVAQAVTPFCSGHRLAELTQQGMQSIHQAPRDEPSARPVDFKSSSRHIVSSVVGAAAAPNFADAKQEAQKGTNATWPPRRLIMRSVMGTLSCLFVVAAGILIRIKTDTGTLIIECASSDVPVEIRQGNDMVKELTLSAGDNKVTLRSGTYEIVLPAKYDSLTLDAGKFELSRGGEWVARISESQESPKFTEVINTFERPINSDDLLSQPSTSASGPSVSPDVTQIISDPIRQVEFQRLRDRYAELLRRIDSLRDSTKLAEIKYGHLHPLVTAPRREISLAQDNARNAVLEMEEMIQKEKAIKMKQASENAESPVAASSQPLYAGKTFDQWLQVIQIERSQEELARALDAIGVLGRGEHDREAANAILDVMGRNEFVDPKMQSVNQSRLTTGSAIRSMRGLNSDDTVPAIADGFSARPPSVHEFVLLGLAARTEFFDVQPDQIFLGHAEPLASRLQANEQLVVQMIQLSESNSGVWSPEKYPGFTHRRSIDPDPIFRFIVSHVGTGKPGPEVETYLRKLVIDPDQIPGDQILPYSAVAAATLLARHTPEELHARIFVRAIRDTLSVSGKAAVIATYPGLGGAFANQDPAVEIQMPSWYGLNILGKHAQPALPYMFEILQHPIDEYNNFNALMTVIRWSDDRANLYTHQANMRLFAIETIGLTQTQDPKALEILRAELMRLIGQTPGDGPFELTPARHALLISPEARPPLNESNGFGQPQPQDISRIDIELTNSCLLAWKALTGNSPRFASDSLGPLITTTGTTGVNIATSTANMPTFVSHKSDEE